MTRTEIATQILAGLVSNPHVVEDAMQSPEWVKDLVDTSLEFADAMLKAERRNRMTSPEKLESFQQI